VPYRIFTIPFDADKEVFGDEELNAFLTGKKVHEVKAEFFRMGTKAYWSVFVHYQPVLGNRVNRGGSWNNNARNCRSANRNNNNPNNRNNNLGFRLASTRANADIPRLRSLEQDSPRPGLMTRTRATGSNSAAPAAAGRPERVRRWRRGYLWIRQRDSQRRI
jgi:hypothetical protein